MSRVSNAIEKAWLTCIKKWVEAKSDASVLKISYRRIDDKEDAELHIILENCPLNEAARAFEAAREMATKHDMLTIFCALNNGVTWRVFTGRGYIEEVEFKE